MFTQTSLWLIVAPASNSSSSFSSLWPASLLFLNASPTSHVHVIYPCVLSWLYLILNVEVQWLASGVMAPSDISPNTSSWPSEPSISTSYCRTGAAGRTVGLQEVGILIFQQPPPPPSPWFVIIYTLHLPPLGMLMELYELSNGNSEHLNPFLGSLESMKRNFYLQRKHSR